MNITYEYYPQDIIDVQDLLRNFCAHTWSDIRAHMMRGEEFQLFCIVDMSIFRRWLLTNSDAIELGDYYHKKPVQKVITFYL